MKKLMALLLSLVMVMSLAACGGNAASSAAPAESTKTEEETAAPSAAPAVTEAGSAEEGSTNEGNATVAETVGDPFEAMAEDYISYPLEGDNTISMWYYIPGYQDFMDSNYSFNALKTAEAATGVKLEFTEVSSQSANELFNVMVAGGDYPDLLPVMEYYTGGLAKAYEDGVIVDINEYMDDNMPNYLAVRDCLDEKTVKATLTEDMTLAFYQIKDGTYSGNGLVSRADWIKAQGVEFSGDVIGLDEFTDYLRTIHDAYNCSNTIYMYDGTVGIEAAFDTELPVLKGDGFMTSVNSAIFRKGDEVMSGWTTDGYREYLEWVLQMMDEGIMAKDFMSLDTDRGVTNTLQASGAIGVWQSNADKITEIIDTYGADYPDLEITAIPRVAQDPTAQYVWNDEAALVATNAGFEPFEYMDGDKYVGIDMEIAKLLADELGVELVINNMDFDAVCLSVGQHKCDIAMAGLTVRADREEYVTFSKSYYSASQKLIVKADDTTFDACKTADDVAAILNQKDTNTKIGVQSGTTGQFYVQGDADWGFDGYPVTCNAYKNGSLAVQDIINGNINYVIIDSAPAAAITAAFNKLA